MDKQELLSQLKDVRLPTEVSWWPLAIGWWLLLSILLALLLAIVIRAYRRYKKHRMSKLAIQELDEIEANKPDNWLMELEVLLKRAALSYFPATKIAQLNEQEWINFLIKTGDEVWSDKSLYALRDYVYQDPSTIDPIDKTLMFQEARQWLTQLADAPKTLKLGTAHA
ncbi:DUF4381 domain-containing protein [Kangiella sp. TOML190]|uniref:DUF4381 domain-containing protein n=1 Tax=Kangiella sp. TOML190 TaxID=2931351 RepID=UPI00203CC964|nr:DUF4381 domain-containing protein [Kangiella sp. TOML190]